MKCQLFRDQNICDYCAKNPPKQCEALETEKRIGGFLFDPVASEKFPDHFKTYLEMSAEPAQYSTAESKCPNWIYSSVNQR